MRVGGHRHEHARLAGEPCVHVPHVEAVGLAVDLERRPRLDRARHDLLDVDVGPRTLVELAARQVADAVDVRVVDRGEQALGRAPVERCVERGDDPVELGEELVGDVDGPVGADVGLDAAQHPERLDAGVDLLDLLPLRLHPPLAQVVRVVGQRQEPVAERTGGVRHLLDRRLPVGRPGRVAVELTHEVRHLDERRQPALAGRLELAGVLAELRRDRVVAEKAVELVLAPEPMDLAGLDHRDAVLRDRQAAPLGLLAKRRRCGPSSP